MVPVRSSTTCNLDGRRDGGLKLREDGEDVVDGLNDVGAGRLEDDDEDGGLAVEGAAGVDVGDGVDDLGDVTDADGAGGVGGADGGDARGREVGDAGVGRAVGAGAGGVGAGGGVAGGGVGGGGAGGAAGGGGGGSDGGGDGRRQAGGRRGVGDRTLAGGDDERSVGRGAEELIRGGEGRARDRAADVAGRLHDVEGADGVAEVLEREALGGEEVGVDLNADGGTGGASGEDLADAGDLRDLLREDGVGGVVHLRQRDGVGGEREDEDGRVGRIDLAIGGVRREVRGQLRAGGVDGGLHIARGAVDVAVEVELHGDAGGAGAGAWRSSG